ncbi:hypothetical protein BH10PLA2_BH10PLA2_33700 [soil metagenome]
MLDALVDHSILVYVLLIVLCSGLLFAWRRTRKWGLLVATVVGLLLVVGYAILTHVVVTDRQKIEDTIRSAALAVEKKDVTTIDRNLARDFRYRSTTRAKFIELAANAIKNGDAKDILVWDFTLDSSDKVKGTAHLTFMAKPHGNFSEGVHFRVEANLAREADGKWRLVTFGRDSPPAPLRPAVSYAARACGASAP